MTVKNLFMSSGVSNLCLIASSASPWVLASSAGSNEPLRFSPSFSAKLCCSVHVLPVSSGEWVAESAAAAVAPNLNSVRLHKNGVTNENEGVAGLSAIVSPSAAPVGVAVKVKEKQEIVKALPIKSQVNRWGGEIYFTIPVEDFTK